MKPNEGAIVVAAVCIALSAMAFAMGDADTGGETNVDTLAERLKGAVVERPTISTDCGGYILKAVDAGAFQRKLRELELNPNRVSELEEQIRVLQKSVADARASSNDELLGAINLKMGDISPEYRLFRNLNRKGYYFRVVHVGQDFIELQDTHEDGATKLIPTNRIAEVTIE
ncbi:MAG: hypothetical protein R3E01_31815 [Pirellulaceae bacterium]|nr:hypothetical protein [Planctomycetales bacterium]